MKKQTFIEVVHNAPMLRAFGTFRHRAFALTLAALLAASACTSVSPSPTLPVSSVPPAPTATHGPTATALSGTPAPSPTAQVVNGSPSPTSTPQSTSSGPSATPGSTGAQTPLPTIDPAVAAQIDQITAQVPPIRELQPTKDVPYQEISRDDFTRYLESQASQDTTPTWQAAEERFLKRLGLLPQDSDLSQLLLQLYSGEVAAYYEPTNGTFYLIETGQPFGPADKVTVAHEYTHALQDQHFDLEGNRIKDPAEGDAAEAQLSVIEGDATMTSQLWMIQNMSEAEQAQLLTQALGELNTDQLASMPTILRRQLEFPYAEGFLFVRDVYGLGGYDAVDQAIQTPPASTEQILHSDKYYSHEAPVQVTLPDLTSNLGSGWSNVYQQTMGELNIQVLAAGGETPAVNIPGLPVPWPHQEVAAGWGGDRLNMYESSDGSQWLIDWQTAWDTQADADEFTARMNELTSTFQGSLRMIQGPQTVEFVLASDPSLFLDLPSG